MRRLLDYDPLTREATYFEAKDGAWTIESKQDVTPIIELNKMMQNDEDYSKRGMKADWWHYAKIPNVIIEKWMREKGVDVFNKAHRKKVFALLNDPEYKYLKTTTKRHA